MNQRIDRHEHDIELATVDIASADYGERAQARMSRHMFDATCSVLRDIVAIWSALALGYYWRYVARWVPGERGTQSVPFRSWIPFDLMFVVILVGCLVAYGHYRRRLGSDVLTEAGIVLRASVVAIGTTVILGTMLQIPEYSRLVVVYGWGMAVTLVIAFRCVSRYAYLRFAGAAREPRRVLVVGETLLGKMVMQNLVRRSNRDCDLVGFIQGEHLKGPAAQGRQDFGRFRCLGDMRDLVAIVEALRIDEVIVALPASQHEAIATICGQCERARVAVKLVPDLFELSLSRIRMDHIAGIPLIDVRSVSLTGTAQWTKRAIDLVLGSLILLAAVPIMVVVALAVRLDSPGPILIRQQRVGKDGGVFKFYKFRSMHVGADRELGAMAARQGVTALRIFKDRRDPRRTRVGRIIRRLSLDELPQIFNVLRGDMSLVGPRPPLVTEVAHYEPHHLKRLQVKGGITGLWQVSGRSNIESFEEIVTMDTYYIENWSLMLDLRILVRTISAVVSRRGAF